MAVPAHRDPVLLALWMMSSQLKKWPLQAVLVEIVTETSLVLQKRYRDYVASVVHLRVKDACHHSLWSGCSGGGT